MFGSDVCAHFKLISIKPRLTQILGRLTFTEDSENQKYLVRGNSSFHRSLTLPPEAKTHLLRADFRNGTLRITMPLS
ncbi:Hsp20/alpha crystallin family protein [Nesterenkonia natronophila]|uniref:Hsp20/alpha crystallin family protein n=1 Tax=Nesterenkonia natronophila TaxID=2174932 RepID=A0A3A4F570_9MICC|nr:Hsp20/alpha crystallin family protein [Nesterenkonia natronophila]